MDTAKYPTATFRLTKPIDLGATVDSTGPVPVSTTGDLTLHGTTRNVTVPLTAQRNNAGIQLSGQIPVTFAEYGIPNPSIGSFVTTDDHGQAEILLNFTRPDPTSTPWMPSFSVPAGAGPAGPRHGRRRRVNPDVVRPRPSTAASATPPAHQPPHQDAATTSPPYHASWLTSSSHGGTNRLQPPGWHRKASPIR